MSFIGPFLLFYKKTQIFVDSWWWSVSMRLENFASLCLIWNYWNENDGIGTGQNQWWSIGAVVFFFFFSLFSFTFTTLGMGLRHPTPFLLIVIFWQEKKNPISLSPSMCVCVIAGCCWSFTAQYTNHAIIII